MKKQNNSWRVVPWRRKFSVCSSETRDLMMQELCMINSTWNEKFNKYRYYQSCSLAQANINSMCFVFHDTLSEHS